MRSAVSRIGANTGELGASETSVGGVEARERLPIELLEAERNSTPTRGGR